MKSFINSIQIDSGIGTTKQQGLINELTRLITTELKEGDELPSVNTLSKNLKISRDTVFKAYSELKRQNIIASTPTKGYFVNQNKGKVLLVLDFYSPFKDVLYHELIKNLDDSYTVDQVFHHYNSNLFDTVITESIGRYNVYLVMNIDAQNFVISDSLKRIDPSKLLLLDIPIENWGDFQTERYSYVWQNFNEAVNFALCQIKERIEKYHQFVYVNTNELNHPSITLSAFEQFCKEQQVTSETVHTVSSLNVEKNKAYFILRQSDLSRVLQQCKEKKLKPGKDVGILVYNDSPLYEFVANGISVISTDFKEMGRQASIFIMENKPVKKVIPTKVILRNSL